MRGITLIAIVGVLSGACGSPTTFGGEGCITGATVACPCPGGGEGAQTCNASRTFDVCVCGAADSSVPMEATPGDTSVDADPSRDTETADSLVLPDTSSADAADSRPTDTAIPTPDTMAVADATPETCGTTNVLHAKTGAYAKFLIPGALSQLQAEYWFKVKSLPGGTITMAVARDGGTRGGWVCSAESYNGNPASFNGIWFTIRYGEAAAEIRYFNTWDADRWYHVACGWDGTTMRVFLNGKNVATKAPGGSLDDSGDGNYFILNRNGFSTPKDYYGREARVRSKSLYVSDFTPSWNLTKDADTLFLFHLNEGTGATVSAVAPGPTAPISGTYAWGSDKDCP